MTKRLITQICVATGLLIAGCTPDVAQYSPSEAPKTLKLQYVRMQHQTAFKPGSADLADGEAEKLARFLDRAEVTAQDRVFFEPAEDDRLATARLGRLAKAVDEKGVGAQTLPPAAAGVAPDQVQVVVERYIVVPPDCPNWTSPGVGDHSNQPYSNFGCANMTNLGLMVADPHDLVVGRPLGPAEGDPALAAMQRYRTDKVTKLKGSNGAGGGDFNINFGMGGY